MSDLAAIQTRLGYQFRDENLLRLALTHPSVAHESGIGTAHNQRLEFLGDAVLQLVLTQKLYEQFSEFDEGVLTKARAKLVNRTTLAEHARALDLGAHLILSRGEETSGGRQRASALADAFESLLGAIFLDGGFDAAREFILREFAADFGTLAGSSGIDNPKGELQELLQSKSPNVPEYQTVASVCQEWGHPPMSRIGSAPKYQTVSATGPDHDRVFECVVQHAGVELARGRGKSKKAAESEAALAALKKLRAETSV